MHQGDRFALVAQGVVDRGAHDPFGAFYRDRFEPDAGAVREADLGVFFRELLFEQGFELFALRSAVLELDPGVDILGVLAEDHHVDVFRVQHRGGHAAVIAHRAHAGVQVQQLAQGHVQRADAAADRGGQRPLDPDQEFIESLDCFVRQPFAPFVVGFLAGVHFHPLDFAFAAVGFFHRRVENPHGSAPDVRPDPVAFNERNDRVIRDIQHTIRDGDLFTLFRHLDFGIAHLESSSGDIFNLHI